jgi:hypothetical protein
MGYDLASQLVRSEYQFDMCAKINYNISTKDKLGALAYEKY